MRTRVGYASDSEPALKRIPCEHKVAEGYAVQSARTHHECAVGRARKRRNDGCGDPARALRHMQNVLKSGVLVLQGLVARGAGFGLSKLLTQEDILLSKRAARRKEAAVEDARDDAGPRAPQARGATAHEPAKRASRNDIYKENEDDADGRNKQALTASILSVRVHHHS